MAGVTSSDRLGFSGSRLRRAGRIRCGYANPPGTRCRETAAEEPTSPRLALKSGGRSVAPTASGERTSLSPRLRRRAQPWGTSCSPPRVARAPAPGGTSDPADRARQVASLPGSRIASPAPPRRARIARFPTVRWSAQFGPKSRPIVRRSRRKLHEMQKVESGGQGRNRTIDTRIFKTTESPVRCE